MDRFGDDFGFLSSLFHSYMYQVPYFLIWGLGIIGSIVYWNRFPKVCLLVLAANLLEMANGIVGTFLQHWFLWGFGIDPGDRNDFYIFLLNMVRGVVSAGTWGMMLLAVYAWREKPPVYIVVDPPPQQTPGPGGLAQIRKPS